MSTEKAWSGKWCTYCLADTHMDAECWCTRPADWHPARYRPIEGGFERIFAAPSNPTAREAAMKLDLPYDEERFIVSLLSVVYPDARYAAEKDIRLMLAERSKRAPAATLPQQEERERVLEDVERALSEAANSCGGTAYQYYLHGLWKAREIVRALKTAAPTGGSHG